MKEILQSKKPEEKERTISRIVWGKILDVIEKDNLLGIFKKIFLVFIAITLSLIWIFPNESLEILKKAFEWKNFAIMKTIFVFVGVFSAENAVLVVSNIKIEKEKLPNGQTIDGIPFFELLDHLFEFESFKRDDIEKKFGIPRNRFTDLAQKLEDLDVLVRGENNARILNNEFARSDVALILEGKSTASELRKIHKQIGSNTWTTKPSKQTIIEKVQNFLNKEKEVLPPSCSFSSRQLGFLEE